jgi:gluconate 2-dehydrogenase gamma chain
VPQFIDRALADYYDKAQAERCGRAGAHGRRRPRRPWRRLRGPDAGAAGRASAGYDREASSTQGQTAGEPHFFPLLEDLVTVGYFTSEPGATVALKYDPVPGAYHGCVPLAELGRGWATR